MDLAVVGLVVLLCSNFLTATSAQSSPSTPPPPHKKGHCCNINESLLWRKEVPPGLSPSAAASIAHLFNHSFLTPQRYLGPSISYYGPATRLRRFVSELVNGTRPLKVGIVGGSISFGVIAIKNHGFFGMFCDWIKSVSTRQITCKNGAVPATPTSYMVLCHRYSLDPDVDLVFVEYVAHDGMFNNILGNRNQLASERLLRLLLSLPRRPAVVLVQSPRTERNQFLPYYDTSEHLGAANEAYYEVPAVSPHTALYHLTTLEAVFQHNRTVKDDHPGTSGHRVYADLLVHLVQQAALDLVHRPLGPGELTELMIAPLQPPVIPGNLPPGGPACMIGEDFKDLTLSFKGWAWMNEGTKAKPKWGFVSSLTGASLVFQVDTLRPSLPPGALVTVYVYYLSSYNRMGTAMLECAKGCSCGRVVADAHITRRVSNTYYKAMHVSQSPACQIRVTIQEASSSGGNRFKVVGAVVTEQPPITETRIGGQTLTKLVREATGFTWTEDSSLGEPGYHATAPGSHLTFQLNTMRPGLPRESVAIVDVYYHLADTPMGTALLECVYGCTCDPVEANAHVTWHVSQTFSTPVYPTQWPACQIRVTVLDKTTSGGHNFHVEGALITDKEGTVNVVRKFELGMGLFNRNPGVEGNV